MIQCSFGPTEKQIEVLYKLLDPSRWHTIKSMTKSEAWQIINAHYVGWRQDPATEKQRKFLEAHQRWTDGMTKGEASDVISSICDRKRSSAKE